MTIPLNDDVSFEEVSNNLITFSAEYTLAKPDGISPASIWLNTFLKWLEISANIELIEIC